MPEKLIRHSGDYRKLLSYQKTEVIYEMTFFFCQNFLEKGDRTVDQMVQAARSGKQNIIEGCAASATSAKTEIKLINVAKLRPVCRNCWRTTLTFFVPVVIADGKRVRGSGQLCANWAGSTVMLSSLCNCAPPVRPRR